MGKDVVGIVGYGYVGRAMHKVFPGALIHDIGARAANCSESASDCVEISSKERINRECGLAVVCVPTPMGDSGGEFKPCDVSAVEEVVRWLETPAIVIKSTIPPGTTARLEAATGKNICFSPEYVGEGGYYVSDWRYMSPHDPRKHAFVIIGGREAVRDSVAQFFVRQLGPEKFYYLVDAIEAELIKYMENSWGAVKVIFANEFSQLCQHLGGSYIRVREGWALDNRVERMHTAVFANAPGFGGKCYPKDLNAIVHLADEVGVDLSLIKAVLRKNRTIGVTTPPHPR